MFCNAVLGLKGTVSFLTISSSQETLLTKGAGKHDRAKSF